MAERRTSRTTSRLSISSTTTTIVQEKEFESVESVARHYEEIIDRLKRLITDGKLKTYHLVDPIRFHKLIEWVAFKKRNLKMVEEAWSSSYFWPFLETLEAAKLVQNDPSQLVIRFSNTHSGAITITRYGRWIHGTGEHKRFEAQVKHKRYIVNDNGMLLSMNGNQNREVSWKELVDYLLTRECWCCLEEIVSSTDAVTLPCRHSFHKVCLQEQLSYIKQQGKEDQCASCRLSFRKMKWPETMDPRSLSTSLTTGPKLSNMSILKLLSIITPPPNIIDHQLQQQQQRQQQNNNDKSEQEPISHDKDEMEFKSEDGRVSLYSGPRCSVSSFAQASQVLENGCNESQASRIKSCPSETLHTSTQIISIHKFETSISSSSSIIKSHERG